jgi:hypothetical protein
VRAGYLSDVVRYHGDVDLYKTAVLAIEGEE